MENNFAFKRGHKRKYTQFKSGSVLSLKGNFYSCSIHVYHIVHI